MKNKIVTPLGTAFSTVENQVSQCDDQTFWSIAETSVIHSAQEKFKQLLPGGSKSPLCTRKYKEVGVAGTPLVILRSKSLFSRLSVFSASVWCVFVCLWWAIFRESRGIIVP